ncbi:MAG: GNAT family N-acetyltransferase [Candidatus Melainabacteria bacterium]|nr:MAG: GNAT family N-acetyltransferase [Candidatus Melainabacteria bacterium]
MQLFAVAKNFQRKQIAQALMCAFVDICYKEEIKYITLEVRESNDKAISLYEKFGMTSVGIRKNYYQDNNENALIMFSENIFYNKFKTIYNEIKKENK